MCKCCKAQVNDKYVLLQSFVMTKTRLAEVSDLKTYIALLSYTRRQSRWLAINLFCCLLV